MLRYKDSLTWQKFVSDNKNLQENKLKEKHSKIYCEISSTQSYKNDEQNVCWYLAIKGTLLKTS